MKSTVDEFPVHYIWMKNKWPLLLNNNYHFDTIVQYNQLTMDFQTGNDFEFQLDVGIYLYVAGLLLPNNNDQQIFVVEIHSEWINIDQNHPIRLLYLIIGRSDD